jgi:nicotinamidase/pyrazinamidase
MAISVEPDDALLIIDVQNGFIPGGHLPVARGDEIVPIINRLAKAFRNVILTQDWHPPGHISFASSHASKKAFAKIALPYGEQVLWPDHCVQATRDADFHPALAIPHAQLIIRKGFRPNVDSYSAFLEADRTTNTGLAGYLTARGLKRVFLCGLATDFCVAWSALDARRFGFDAFVIEDACRAIDVENSLAQAWQSMLASGVQRIRERGLA